jgi:hypothetical protein
MQMIIASRLVDGRVVFMDADSGWADSIAGGVLADTKSDAERLMTDAFQAVEACEIVDPYLIEVVITDGERVPTEIREAIRAFGPSIRTDLLAVVERQ